MDTQNIHLILSQLKAIAENIGKVVKGINNPLTIWVPILTTLFLGFIAIFQDKIRFCIFKPKLKVIFREPILITNSGNNRPLQYDFLFEIKNIGESTLEDCEALVTEIWELNGGGEKLLNPWPFNLIWKGKGGTTILKIPPNTYKFFDFGNIIKPKPESQKLVHNSVTFPSPTNIELIFATGGGTKPLKSNVEYKIIIIFSGNNIDPLIKTYKLTLNDKWADNPDNIKEMVLIEEC